MTKAQLSEQVQVNFRMPADLKSRIEAAAAANSRSTTAEIVSRLEASLDADVIPHDVAANLSDRLKSIEQTMRELEKRLKD